MVVVAPKQLRGPGTIGVTRPATGAQPGTYYVFTALMDAADIQDPTLVLQFRLFLDARNVYDNSFQCGAIDRNGNPKTPGFGYSCPEAPPANFRIETDLPRPVNIGLDISLGSVTRLT